MQELAKAYPETRTALRHETPYQLLIATILSAQCTDERVNQVTSTLFRDHPDSAAILDLSQENLESYIRSCGLYRNKARNILAASRLLEERYEGRIPNDRDALMSLPGVGRKTANVVLANVHEMQAIAVDTHVFRVSRRLGLARGGTPRHVEEDLMETLPREEWAATHHRLIAHGRAVCRARRPLCEECPLTRWCDWYAANVTVDR
ncbi:MAG TPA: endonuclease III [Gemmatimonadota bacterium]|nr:endonuclease III [Gemmatimonadota bacterium]